MHILLVEDDTQLGDSLQRALRSRNYLCDWVTGCEDARFAVGDQTFDLLILDWMLPDGNGPALLAELRRTGMDAPVLMLSARSETRDRISGLDAGADDYLPKPFDLEELFARLRALLRRGVVQTSNLITAGEVVLDLDRMSVTENGQPVAVAVSEFHVLRALAARSGAFLSKDQIAAAAYDWDSEITPNAIEAQISRLRKKLAKGRISTLRGIGYRLEQSLP